MYVYTPGFIFIELLATGRYDLLASRRNLPYI